MNEIIAFALENGLWATLFCCLFFYMLKDSRSREKKYTSIIISLNNQISTLTQSLENMDEIIEKAQRGLDLSHAVKKDIDVIKDCVFNLKCRKELL